MQNLSHKARSVLQGENQDSWTYRVMLLLLFFIYFFYFKYRLEKKQELSKWCYVVQMSWDICDVLMVFGAFFGFIFLT